MTAIYLLRHGEADYEPVRERRWPGSMAELAPLSARGREEVAAAAAALGGVGATALVSSPYTRTMQTSGIVACRLGLSIEVDFGLHEWLPDDSFGWLTHADVREFVADFEALGGEWPDGEHRPWEPLSAVRRRAAAALRTAVSQLDGAAPNGVLIAVCHNMVIRSLTGEEIGTGQFRRIDSGTLPG